MFKQLKSNLSKLNFALGRNPEIKKTTKWRNFIPKPYKSVLLISADFELAWAWRYTKSTFNPLQKALIKAKQERNNLPRIIELSEYYDIPFTWATVGHLFLEKCEIHNNIAHSLLPRPAHFENNYWRYYGDDWYEHDPCTNYKIDPEWYCPDLIRKILDSNVQHEIACHTFSHIDCRDTVCSPELLSAELKECKKIAKKWNIDLKSFVHPGHTIGNLDTIAREGFTNFRTDYNNVLGYPKKHSNGLWEFEQTAEFVYREDWSIEYHIARYIEILKRSIRTNTVCVFWFHPSFNKVILEDILPKVFEFVKKNSSDIWVTTHNEYTKSIQSINNEI